jgi:hypothetical protein
MWGGQQSAQKPPPGPPWPGANVIIGVFDPLHQAVSAQRMKSLAPVADDIPVLRIFRCRPSRVAFDNVLRDVFVPDLLSYPAVRDVLVGRMGPEETGERLVASVWESARAMLTAMGDDIEASRFHPEYLDATTDRTLEVLPLAVCERWPDDRPVTILRLSRGTVRPSSLGEYVKAARDGALADRKDQGPVAFYLATVPSGFVTLSSWSSWAAIEAATGADTTAPISTRHNELISDFAAEHFEALPLARRPSSRAMAST